MDVYSRILFLQLEVIRSSCKHRGPKTISWDSFLLVYLDSNNLANLNSWLASKGICNHFPQDSVEALLTVGFDSFLHSAGGSIVVEPLWLPWISHGLFVVYPSTGWGHIVFPSGKKILEFCRDRREWYFANDCFLENSSQTSGVVNINAHLFRIIAFHCLFF